MKIDLNRIDELLEKYYQGETSTAEEQILRDFFSSEQVPEHLMAEAELFGFFKNEGEKQEDTLSGEMETRLDKLISHSLVQKPAGLGRSLRYYWISAAAAVILILLGIFADRKLKESAGFEVMQDTYEDPYLAYVEAKRVLYMVSETMNTARQPLKNLEKLDSGVNYMHPIFSFGAGIQHLEHLNTIEKTKELISK